MTSDPDLAVLSVERYHDGSHSPPPARQQAANEPKSNKSEGTVGMKRKRDKEDSASGDEEKKKSRGRPRLEMNDETAADRRRTQIRLAQRAYRDRKELAITALEKKVEELETTNNKMSHAFMDLYQAAISDGLAVSAPDFGRKMTATMEAFAIPSRRSSGDNPLDEEESPTLHRTDMPGLSTRAMSQIDSMGMLRAARADLPVLDGASNSIIPTTTPKPTRNDEYIISHELSAPADIQDPSDLAGFTCQQTQAPLAFGTTAPQPTFSTSSFLIDPFSTAPSTSPLDLLASASNIDLLPNTLATPLQLYPQPPLPTTYSHLEHSFARHLQRRAVEYSYRLITTPSTPPETLARVFGFCMLFETTDMIRARLARGISRTREEFVNAWTYPIVHFGGAGMYNGVGGFKRLRESTADPRRPKHGTGFSQGPFRESVARAIDEKLGPALRISIPGFEDAFFDSEDIQEYLAERGVNLPPGVDRAVVEVDMDAFKNGDGDAKIGTIGTVETENMAAAMGARDVVPLMPAAMGQMGQEMGLSSAPPAALSMPQQTWAGSLSGDTMGMTGLMSTYGLSSTIPDLGYSSSVTPFSGMTNESARGTGSRREVVTLDVNIFIQELVCRGSCLGRTPGFRRGDVNDAFLLAAIRGPEF